MKPKEVITIEGKYTVRQFLTGPTGLQPNSYPAQVYMTVENGNQAKFSIFRDMDALLCRDAIGGEPWSVNSMADTSGSGEDLKLVTLTREGQTLVLKARPGMQY